MNNENKGIHPTGVSSRVWIALVALCVANVVAHLMVMPSLPAQIPTHWGVVPAVGSVNVLISGVVGLLFIGVGNYLPRVKQNYTLGIKTPWALADPENWRRTQRFGGACFMELGIGLIVMGVAGSVLSSEVVAAVIAVLAFGSVGAVYVYSYLLWRKSQRAAR